MDRFLYYIQLLHFLFPGDYIALYQSQRLALKERAKEKDAQLDNLAKERELLLRKLAELTELLKEMKKRHLSAPTNSASFSEVSEKSRRKSTTERGPIVSTANSEAKNDGDDRLETRIDSLLKEISSSSLIENFHPCGVCSGQLMTV